MPANNNHLQSLFQKYMTNTCTKEEWEEFLQLVKEETNEPGLTQAIKSYWDSIQTTETNPAYWDEKFKEMMEEIGHPSTTLRTGSEHKASTKSTTPVRTIWKWVAAAAVIVIIATTVIVISKRSEKSPAPIAKTNDVPAPSNTRAVITLADGSKVYLDSANKGTIAHEKNVAVVKNAEGEIVYNANGEQRSANSLSYNTLFNPRGSKVISLILSDGTKVWLNSESSLKYPIAFNSNSREVEITGEAYFEVKHNSKQPFKVHLPNGGVVEDIGTSFNVNAYTDETDIKTTLIEGSIAVSLSPAKTEALTRTVLKRGQQAVVSLRQAQTDNRIQVQTNIDLESVLAWKNGLFSFDNADIENLMKQIARWYDIEVVYESRPTKIFRGSIPREMSAAKVFKALEETGGVHFRIEGKKVIVMK